MHHNASFLVVDDMEGMRRLLANSLRQLGFGHIQTANNGSEAWHMLLDVPFDMVLTDWNMPVLNGLDLLKRIRAHPGFGALPVIMLTAETDSAQVRNAVEAGVSEYLVKPFNLAALEAKIQRAFAYPRPQAQVARGFVPALLPQRAGAKALQGSLNSLTTAAQSTEARRATVLVVDDVPDNLTILVEMLGQDYQVKAANSGLRALKIVESGKIPDLILLDVMMPEMDGFEVCRRLKANPATVDVPVIFLTAMGESTDVTKGFSMGAADYVTKPADAAILKVRIETHLKLQRSFAELKTNRIALIEKNAVLEDNLHLREEVERISRHDLRNPLAGIIGFAGNLLADDTLAQPHKDVVHYIEQSAYSVLNMVNLSLDLYKMERGEFTFHPRPVDIGAILERILREMRAVWTQRQLSLLRMHDGLPRSDFSNLASAASGDELLCYCLFSNLLRNAAEASPDSGTVEICITTGDDLQIAIRNTGAVPQVVRSTFFDKYASAGKPDGNGLGTYSARLMATTQKGSIEMQTSDTANTTTVTVHLAIDPSGLQRPTSP